MSISDLIFLPECEPDHEAPVVAAAPITNPAAVLTTGVSEEVIRKGADFADEIDARMITEFGKPGDKMVHVSSYALIDGMIYVTYYANPHTADEAPQYQTARMVCCPVDDVDNKTYHDLQSAGDTYHGKTVDAVYDTILLRMDDETLYLMWTARLSGNYYRLYRTYAVGTGEMGAIRVNRLKVGQTTVDFSFSGIQKSFAQENVPLKTMYSDIGVMQKLTSRIEQGETYYYTGAYSGDLTFIIRSRDLITWEYVAQPDFPNESKWENATYVIGDRCYYFVRQADNCPYGFLTCYDLDQKTWAQPVLIGDSQSRGDFIRYEGRLYLFHAPIDRNHLGVVEVDQENIASSRIVLQARMHESCFYPFIQYGDGELHLSYTSARRHIRLSKFDAAKYLN